MGTKKKDLGMKEKLVSVVMPAYNCEKYIGVAIKSILDQTHKNIELIIVDDCSTDNTWGIIKEFSSKDNRIKAIKNNNNLGIPKTRNRLFHLMSEESEYVAILDSDDISLPNRLEEQIKVMEESPEVGIIGSNTLIINEFGKIIGIRNYPIHHYDIIRTIGHKNPFTQSSVMLRKDVLLETGFYNEKYASCQDYDLWFRILERCAGYNIKEPLILYRISKSQNKNISLRTTLNNTLKIQYQYLFNERYGSWYNRAYFLLEIGLFLLPNSLILWLFKKKEYKVN